jgi:hypothetical protein
MGLEDLFRLRWLNASCLFRLADPRREGTATGESMPIPDIRQAAIDVDPPQGRVRALVAATGARVSRRFFEFFAVNVRNPHTRRAQDWSAEQSARSRRK